MNVIQAVGTDRSPNSEIIEYVADPASGGFFNADYKKHDDLKQMLDSNKDSLKLEAMKRIIGMIAKGRDASDLFPAVVKNVVSKNIEVKKLVYVYLVRYAEDQQDLALLSISTFQRALKDPNQLIRASALRVLSSIRVSMIVPIVMLAIRESSSDMSPYVRKTVAHAIPKLFSLDSEQKDELVMVIEKLLSDKTTLVVGSAVMAFEEVCPERVDLIHKNYRKLCSLLVDIDEWGQIIIINMLTRYARTQFANPNIDEYQIIAEGDKSFYEESESSNESSTDIGSKEKQKLKCGIYTLDLDHRLLLRQAKPLLQSRNASVVMAVAQLYYHVAPSNEVNLIAKALIRLLRNNKEVQSVVLSCIGSMSEKRKFIFEPYLKSFFVRTSDPTHLKLLKLEILTNLAAESSISIILREFQTYININDKQFVAATIQAIGRCAALIKEVSETCLTGLVHLLSNRDEYVVAESVVVIKKLLQNKAAEHNDIIIQMAKLLDFITVPAARASILWLIGEYNSKVPTIGPDVLRKMAKTFIDEEDAVKLQILNLAVKLYLTNVEQTELLCQYVFNLTKYDQNYDIRDRARFLRHLLFPNNTNSILRRNAISIFLSEKPSPTLESKYHGREQFQLGSLSHYLNMRANGYNDLPDFAEVASDPSVRNVESRTYYEEKNLNTKDNTNSETQKKDYSQSRKSSSYSETSSDSESSSEIDKSDGKNEKNTATNGDAFVKSSESKNELNSENENSSTSSTDSDTSDSSENSSDDSTNVKKNNIHLNNDRSINNMSDQNDLDLLLNLDIGQMTGNIMSPSFALEDKKSYITTENNAMELVGPTFVSSKQFELLNKVNGYGLGIQYKFTRLPNLFSSSMTSIELDFFNHSATELTNIRINKKHLPNGTFINEFPTIQILVPQRKCSEILGVNFNDTTHSIELEISSNEGNSTIKLKAPIGELIRSIKITENNFKEQRSKLRGMNENQIKISQNIDLNIIKQKIFETANVAYISGNSNTMNFCGQTMSTESIVLITVQISDENILLTVNCEKVIVGSMLLNDIKANLLNK